MLSAPSSPDRTDPDGAGALSALLPGVTDGVLPAACPSRTVLDHVTSKWGVLVIIALSDGTHRWSALRRVVQGVSEKMLAQTLRTLEADGLVHREARPVVPPHVEYRLTDRGHELAAHMLPLMGWITANAEDIVAGAARR